jgi:exopolyphosphatase/guanosine-5'-triphosphate,3'-diphosphate pyrophosphatase
MNQVLGAIDIGTNSFHLVIAEVDNKGIVKVLTSDREVVRLSRSSTDMKYITEESMQRGIQVLQRFKKVCDNYKCFIRAVGTSATREALNRDEFITRVYTQTGIKIEVVSGFEESRLIYLGALQALPIYNKKILLIDIGGGSTEFVIGYHGNIIYANSIKIGAVRLTEKFFHKKPSYEVIDQAKLYIKGMISNVTRFLVNHRVEMVVGTSGTIMAIANVIFLSENKTIQEPANLNGYVIKQKAINKIASKIYNSKMSELGQIKGIQKERRDIIRAGALIFDTIVKELGIDKVVISSYALREGIILDTIDKEHNTLVNADMANVRYRSIMNLGKSCNFDKLHSEQVAKIALKIFDFLSNKYNLDSKDKEFLEAAALMHDIGSHISHFQHHRHSYYLIVNSDLLGYNYSDLEIIANIARYHRKSHPKIKHENYNKLDYQSKEKVKKLAGILRIADGLDRGHCSVVKDIELKLSRNALNITVITSAGSDASLEIWAANNKKTLFEESFSLTVNIELKK